jgi:hypothetical protein
LDALDFLRFWRKKSNASSKSPPCNEIAKQSMLRILCN